MFLIPTEMKTVVYDYQLAEIVEADATLVPISIATAMEEIKSYLCSRYDIVAVYATTGANRNPLILELCKDITLWNILKLSNPDIIYDKAKDRYDRTIATLDKIAKGIITPTLPLIVDEAGAETTPIKFGSIDKQQYDW